MRTRGRQTVQQSAGLLLGGGVQGWADGWGVGGAPVARASGWLLVVWLYRLERNRERLLADTTMSRAAKLGEFSNVTSHTSHVTPGPYLPTPSSRHVSTVKAENDLRLCGRTHPSHFPRLSFPPPPFSHLTLQPPLASRWHDEGNDDTLLHSVRRELDQSIAKHLDPGKC